MPYRQNYDLVYMVVVTGFIFICIGFITAKIVAGYISRPLKELEDYTVRIAHKDWKKEPIEVKSKDEIGRLAASMNKMRKELMHADEEEKMFLQSISHDLKTPVMVIMSHADAIIDGVYIDSVEKTAEIIRDEAISLEKKIKQMLYLNTLDYVLENDIEEHEINLFDLLQHIISRFEVINSKIEWDMDIDKVFVMGNKDRIQVAIENVIDNGLRYANESIKIVLKKDSGFAVLDIFNDGPNIDEKHLGRIFDNLYKDKKGNFGLGLAISKKIVDHYNGQISAINREKGVSFIIKLPI
jgi:two-component system, OmpR family, sensor histidine kinase CssS